VTVERTVVSENNYLSLFMAAGVSNRYDHERYGRYVEAAVAQERIDVDQILGVGEQGTGSKPDLYIIDRRAIVRVSEIGLFNKRMTIEQVAPVVAIAKLSGTQEGYKGTDVTITGTGSRGEVVFKIAWGLGGPDWVEPLVMRQREHLFKVISEAMDGSYEPPVRPAIATASSKAGALMDWAADVVMASGVMVTSELVEEHANMVAATMRLYEFMPLGAPLGIDSLGKFFPSGEMPPGTPLDTFDDLYKQVVATVGSSTPVDQAIDRYLAEHWAEFVNGCRETYS
jgi:hypothetical protein